ncbi:zinc finger protein 449 [Drosophila sulfurigaster albostrigata]|uniref:zinc finger protein 449 n=1 Tax=Drosophila sulfurigaster albostrigata TaxID=89887 RepID=UPI002D219251|nr:zinc finger protein 449 [Drosophila sulfurigaster albostrigata]
MELPARIVYVCSLCLRQYDLLEDLRGHMMFFHGYKPLPTSGVKQLNAKQTETQLSKRVSMPPPSPSPPAELQPMPFKDFRLALRVNMRVPCTEITGCVYKFEDANKQTLHGKCHKGETYSCSECGLEQANWRRCSAHLWKEHQIDVDLLQCPVAGCDYKSPLSALVWRHMRVHKKWRTRVLRRELWRRRIQKQQQQQQQLLLDEATNSQAPLQPAAEVKKNKYYAEKTCEICQQKFVNGKTLSKHVKTVHNKIKPFICNVCGKKTARKASLIIHMRQHTGEKPLKCEHCKFATRDPSSLFKHRQRHLKDATATTVPPTC